MNRKASARALFLATVLCCLAQIKPCVATLTPEEMRARRMARFGAAAGGSGQIGRRPRAAPVQTASKEDVAGSPAAGAAMSQDTRPVQSINIPAPPAKKQATSREPSPPLATSTPVTQPEEKNTPAPVTDDCCVCRCPPVDGEKLACDHVICKDCLIGWFESSARPDVDGNIVANGSQCPICRRDAFTDDCRPSHPDVAAAYKKFCGNGGNTKTADEITEAGVEMSDELRKQNISQMHDYETFGPNAAEIKKQIEEAAKLQSEGMPAELAAMMTGIMLKITPDGPRIGIAPHLRAPKWTCRHCTYAGNSGGQSKCEVCTLPRNQ